MIVRPSEKQIFILYNSLNNYKYLGQNIAFPFVSDYPKMRAWCALTNTAELLPAGTPRVLANSAACVRESCTAFLHQAVGLLSLKNFCMLAGTSY